MAPLEGASLNGDTQGDSATDQARPAGPGVEEQARRLRQRNLAVLAALIGLVVLFYVITVVRMSSGSGG